MDDPVLHLSVRHNVAQGLALSRIEAVLEVSWENQQRVVAAGVEEGMAWLPAAEGVGQAAIELQLRDGGRFDAATVRITMQGAGLCADPPVLEEGTRLEADLDFSRQVTSLLIARDGGGWRYELAVAHPFGIDHLTLQDVALVAPDEPRSPLGATMQLEEGVARVNGVVSTPPGGWPQGIHWIEFRLAGAEGIPLGYRGQFEPAVGRGFDCRDNYCRAPIEEREAPGWGFLSVAGLLGAAGLCARWIRRAADAR